MASSETRIVAAIALPSDEPRLPTLRERPETSPYLSLGKLDCTTLTEGVSITPRPRPRPITSRPGTNAQLLDESLTNPSRSPTPAIVTTKAPRIRGSLRTPLGESLLSQRRHEDPGRRRREDDPGLDGGEPADGLEEPTR